uniref:Right handed beta helix domain-containing protein n=1 Tax=Cyclophora tenuis TaxID=216820 RepID=A0A7S1GQ59_CYCTE
MGATDFSFIRHVLPVEMGSFMQTERPTDHNHYHTIAEAISIAQPGDTIELGDGHYWVNEPGLSVDVPLKFVGDENNPSHVVIELSGSVRWRANGFLEGVTFRRPKISSGKEKIAHELMSLTNGVRVNMVHCVLNNEGSMGHVVSLRMKSKGSWFDTQIKGSGGGDGIFLADESELELVECSIVGNSNAGIMSTGGTRFKAVSCQFDENKGSAVSVQGHSKCEILKSRFGKGNGDLIVREAGSACAPCQANVAILPKGLTRKPIPGVRYTQEEDEDI